MNKTKAAMAIQVLPTVTDREKLVEIVDAVIENIEKKGFNYEVSAFETTIDADLDSLLEIIKESAEICIEKGAPSLMSYIKLNYNPEGVMSIEEKTEKHKKSN